MVKDTPKCTIDNIMDGMSDAESLHENPTDPVGPKYTCSIGYVLIIS